MVQPTTVTTDVAAPATDVTAQQLLPILLLLLTAHRPAFRQERPFQRCCALVVGHLLAFGRHTVTQLLVALGLGQVDWSGFYRLFSAPRFDYDTLCARFLAETLAHVPAETPYTVGLDGVQIPRSSRTFPGSSWHKAPRTPAWKPGIHRAQRFVHLAWLVPVGAWGYSRAIPLRLLAAFPPKAVLPAGYLACKEWEAGLAALIWLRGALDAAGRVGQCLVAAADGVYGPADLWRDLPANTVLIARCAKNRALYHRPPPYAGKGRPRTYGARVPAPRVWLHLPGRWQTITRTVRGYERTLTFRVCGPYLVRGAPTRPVFLIVVKGVARKSGARREPTYWLVSASQNAAGRWVVPRTPPELLTLAWQRWELEVTHREAKTGFGVGEAQCWSPTAAVLGVQWQWWAFGVVLLTAYRAWGLSPSTLPPLGRWWGGPRRWTLGTAWQQLRAEIWELGAFQPVWTRFPANWEKLADWLTLQTAAVLGARRG